MSGDHDDIAAGLPPEGDSEPPSLRGDIIDELADHLRLAARRETMRDPAADDAKVGAAVFARFGDPRKVARELYFDAMKERIMKDRILIGLMVVITLAVSGMAFLLFQQNQQNQQIMQAMLAKLEERPSADVSERGTIEVRVVDEQNKPLSGVEVELIGEAVRVGQRLSLKENTDDQGVSFRDVLPGAYDIVITQQFDRFQVAFNREVVLMPRTVRTERVVQPEMPRWFPVTLRLKADDPSRSDSDAALKVQYELPDRFGLGWVGHIEPLDLLPLKLESLTPKIYHHHSELLEGTYTVLDLRDAITNGTVSQAALATNFSQFRPAYVFRVDQPITVDLPAPRLDPMRQARLDQLERAAK